MTVIEKVSDKVSPALFGHDSKVVQAGHIVEVTNFSKVNREATIRRLDNSRYVVLSTGEIKTYTKRTETRQQDSSSFARSMRKLKSLINANFVASKQTHWCTLTYAENMTDRDRLRHDFNLFTKRFFRYCDSKFFPKPALIGVPEPQARGAWHVHLLIFWDMPVAPYIENSLFASFWQQGFVNIKRLAKRGSSEDIDNLGNYLTAYLTDMPLSDADRAGVFYTDSDISKKKGKMFVKGARLSLYPSGCRLFFLAGTVKRPTTTWVKKSDVNGIFRQRPRRLLRSSTVHVTVYKEVDGEIYNSFDTYIQKNVYYRKDFSTDIYDGFVTVMDFDIPVSFR